MKMKNRLVLLILLFSTFDTLTRSSFIVIADWHGAGEFHWHGIEFVCPQKGSYISCLSFLSYDPFIKIHKSMNISPDFVIQVRDIMQLRWFYHIFKKITAVTLSYSQGIWISKFKQVVIILLMWPNIYLHQVYLLYS